MTWPGLSFRQVSGVDRGAWPGGWGGCGHPGMKVMVVSMGGPCGQGGEADISEAGRPGEERWCGAGDLGCILRGGANNIYMLIHTTL